MLHVDDLHVQPVGNASGSALEGVDLIVNAGETHAILGLATSGASSLVATLMGSSAYDVQSGSIEFQGDDITEWPTDERAKAGMFLGFQHPYEIPGVSVIQFLRRAVSAQHGVDMSVLELRFAATAWMQRLGMNPSDLDRHLDDGFTRGEQRRNDLLHMAILQPALAILDDTGGAPDDDATHIAAEGLREIRADQPDMAVVLITDNITGSERLLDEITPDHVHLLVDGRIVTSGGLDLSARLESVRLEADGFTAFRTTVGVNV